MKTNPEIFKAYDIRGIFNQDMDEETAYLVGRSFVDFLKPKNPKNISDIPDFAAFNQTSLDAGVIIILTSL